jgi:hypothetical protein
MAAYYRAKLMAVLIVHVNKVASLYDVPNRHNVVLGRG